MKPLSLSVLVGAIAIPLAACFGCGTDGAASVASTSAKDATALTATAGAAAAAAAASSATHVATLAIQGMTCASCAVTVRTAARKLDGLQDIDVDVDAGRATVHFDGNKVSAQQIADKISTAGYATTVASDGES